MFSGGKVMLDEFGDDSFAGDEVGHGHVGHFDDAFGDGVGERGNAVDDDEGVADEGGLHGGGAAGDDGGAGVMEGGGGILYQMNGRLGRGLRRGGGLLRAAGR
jgi:hypothetical protein